MRFTAEGLDIIWSQKAETIKDCTEVHFEIASSNSFWLNQINSFGYNRSGSGGQVNDDSMMRNVHATVSHRTEEGYF